MAQDTQRYVSGDRSAAPSGTYDPDGAPETVESLDPTRDLYEDLNLAFRFFNERLFSNALKPSLITLRATGRTHGYFSPGRFVDTRTGVKVNEIAFNPEDFARRGVEDVLSTLVHEMVHQQQAEDGTASRRAYHNKDFEKKMRAVGLVPSATGLPGAPSVGEKMTHYIDVDGPFLRIAKELIDTQFRIRWADRFSTTTGGRSRVVIAAAVESAPTRRTAAVDAGEGPEPEFSTPPRVVQGVVQGVGQAARVVATPAASGGVATPRPIERHAPGAMPPASAPEPEPESLTFAPPLSAAPVETMSGIQVPRPLPKPNLSKTKHVCLTCGNSAWGKPSLNLICGDCKQTYVATV